MLRLHAELALDVGLPWLTFASPGQRVCTRSHTTPSWLQDVVLQHPLQLCITDKLWYIPCHASPLCHIYRHAMDFLGPQAQSPGCCAVCCQGYSHISLHGARGRKPSHTTLLRACIRASRSDGTLNPAQGQHRTAIQHLQRVLEISGAMGDHVVRSRACQWTRTGSFR